MSKKVLTKEQIEAIIDADPNLKEFIESGDHKIASVYNGMAYLCNCVGNSYLEEFIEIMEKYKLMHKKLKTRCVNYITAFNLFDEEIRKSIFGMSNPDKVNSDICDDFDSFKDMCENFLLSESHWQISDTREDGLYLCYVEGAKETNAMLLRWKDGKWYQYNQIAGWIGIGNIIVKKVNIKIRNAS